MGMIKYPLLNRKYRDFLNHQSKVDFLEGTTYGGKTTVGIQKFIESVAVSDKTLHVLAGLDLGVVEKNIINKDLGILDTWGNYITYRPKGNIDHTSPHLSFKTSKGEKIIYVMGYDNKKRWQKILGGQYGSVMVDEINTADVDFVREVFMRNDYLLATLNPDNPELDVYKEYINRSRPLEKYVNDVPASIAEELIEPEEEDWVHWFFTFDDNPSLTEDKRETLLKSVPKGTKQYKNKILGERGKAEGLVFPNFDKYNVLTNREVKSKTYVHLNIGIDTSYSVRTDDTIVFSLVGLTDEGQLVVIDEEIHTNQNREKPYTPSDVSEMFWKKFDEWGELGAINDVYIDSADQPTRLQMEKDARMFGVRKPIHNSNKIKIIERVNHTNNWIDKDEEREPTYYVNERCTTHIKEMSFYSYDKGVPEDRNDHTINAVQYAFIPLISRVGVVQQDNLRNRQAMMAVANRLM